MKLTVLAISWAQALDVSSFIIVIISVGVGLLLYRSRAWVWFECTSKTQAYLPIYVSRLEAIDIGAIIFFMAIKYALKPIGIVPKLRPAADGLHMDMPELKMRASIQIDDGDAARYDKATGHANPSSKKGKAASSQSGDRIMLLPALTFPMVSAIMANHHCPVLAFGSVNTMNRFEFLDPEACRDPAALLDLPKATVTGRIGGDSMPGRRVKRGVEFDVEVALLAARKGATQQKVVFRQIFTVLSFLSESAEPRFKPTEAEEETPNWGWATSSTGELSFTTSAPQLWAALCADYNPIHVSGIMAKLFGFPGRLAHGNHVLACAIEKLHEAKGKKAKLSNVEASTLALLYSKTPSALEVHFKRPMVLPISLEIDLGAADGKYSVKASKKDKDHLIAEIMELKP